MLGFIFLETVCAALARDKDEPEEQAETDEGEESLESHYRARHFLLPYHSLVVVHLCQEILVTSAGSTVMIGGFTLSEKCC